jgi:hypothetical protein
LIDVAMDQLAVVVAGGFTESIKISTQLCMRVLLTLHAHGHTRLVLLLLRRMHELLLQDDDEERGGASGPQDTSNRRWRLSKLLIKHRLYVSVLALCETAGGDTPQMQTQTEEVLLACLAVLASVNKCACELLSRPTGYTAAQREVLSQSQTALIAVLRPVLVGAPATPATASSPPSFSSSSSSSSSSSLSSSSPPVSLEVVQACLCLATGQEFHAQTHPGPHLQAHSTLRSAAWLQFVLQVTARSSAQAQITAVNALIWLVQHCETAEANLAVFKRVYWPDLLLSAVPAGLCGDDLRDVVGVVLTLTQVCVCVCEVQWRKEVCTCSFTNSQTYVLTFPIFPGACAVCTGARQWWTHLAPESAAGAAAVPRAGGCVRVRRGVSHQSPLWPQRVA